MTVYSATQSMNAVQKAVALVLGIPAKRYFSTFLKILKSSNFNLRENKFQPYAEQYFLLPDHYLAYFS